MPKFILDTSGTVEDNRPLEGDNDACSDYRWDDLDAFTQGYIECMFFTNTGDRADGRLESAAFCELSAESLDSIIKDCARFQAENKVALYRACDGGTTYDETQAGHDFWYTRNHHGCGYWDRDLGDVGDLLTTAAHKWGEVDLYRGDDGKVWIQ